MRNVQPCSLLFALRDGAYEEGMGGGGGGRSGKRAVI